MLKKIIFTALVIFLVLFIARWRQKKAAEVAANVQSQGRDSANRNVAIYYLAGSVITLMVLAVVYWFFMA